MERKKCIRMNSFYIVLFLPFVWKTTHAGMTDCYLQDGTAQRCLPPFENAAFAKMVMASNTCGSPAEEYCVQTGVTGVTRSCHICDSRDPSRSHSTEYLTDLNDENPTWWQSSTMVNDVQYPNMVNLTLNLNKAFDITYVRVRFHTSRPESFAIYKKKCDECDWQPFQYYSGSCFTTYQIDNKEIVTGEDEQKALCTDDFSDISPLTGGNVAFSTLEGRPGAYNFDRSPVLQDWVKAVAIRITLNRINTFGDEVFNDPKILRSYYYGISDLSVGGRCTCNGHASECHVSPDGVLQCQCEHNTAGRDCERCDDFYNDRPWARGTRDEPNVCQACECNGMSDTCYFDVDLYLRTGHGGHCTNCRENTGGPHCEFCEQYHYRDSNNACQPCDCGAVGSERQQCDEQGRCSCKAGVGGPRCDQCLEGYYGLTEGGCRACNCDFAGTVEGSICDSATGACQCKLNVEGQRCDRCTYGTMNLQASNPYGCTACFCFGQSSVCEVASNYTVAYIVSEFDDDNEGWEGQDFYENPLPIEHRNGRVSMSPGSNYLSYFVAPGKFLGVQRFSYNQFLEFELSVEDLGFSDDPGSGADVLSDPVAFPSREDIVLVGAGFKVAASITSQGNSVPNSEPQLYRFRLHEKAGFSPELSPFNFQKMLNELESLKIRSTYGERLQGHLDNVQLATAEKYGAGPPANWVEKCELAGYEGQFTEKCAPGFTRDPPNGGVYAPCVQCNCNGHAVTCKAETGECECLHNTMGEHCELCEPGFYFSGDESRRGTPQECQPCPCPDQSACLVVDDGSVVCTNCPPGHAGRRCESCLDGWFGEPLGRGPCLRCMCNGNIDENAVMNCDRVTGECLKCIYNTTGSHCERCLEGYFGSPFSKDPEKQCRLCECNSLGSNHVTSCDSATGACDCLPNVEGRQCERCASGYWNLASGAGCEPCNCNLIGASAGECDEDSGQCICQPGVMGQKCDQCQPNHYGLSRVGCTACNCNPDGSQSLQCLENGRCICKDGVYGIKCDQCQENYYDLVNGCIACPTCYGLVQDAVNDHRSELQDLENIIESTGELPQENQNNAQFRKELDDLNATAHALLERGLENQRKWDAMSQKYVDSSDSLNDLLERLLLISDKFDECNMTVENAENMNSDTQDNIATIRGALASVKTKLDRAMMDLSAAQVIADESLSKENNMSRLAEEAQAIAADHQNQSKYIFTTAQAALDTSTAAKNLIEESITTLDSLINALEDLIDSENKIPAARKLREDLLAQSGKVKNNTEIAKMESTDLYTQASKLAVPDVDTDSMDRRSQDVLSESQNLMPELEALDKEYRDNFGSLQTEADKAADLLAIANAAQNTADMLLAQSHAALQDAHSAVAKGNQSYLEILDIIATLETYDEEIRENREEAEAALENAGDIRRKIDEANGLTDTAKAALGEAKSVAKQASDNAQQAKDIAESVQENAERVRNEADASHSRATEISNAVERIDTDLATTEENLNAAEDQADRDQAQVDDATRAANEAKQNAMESKKQVNSVLKQLQDLLDRLNNAPDVTAEDLLQLEDRYKVVQDAVNASHVEDTISRLERVVEKQQEDLTLYDYQIKLLRNDIENLEDIKATLPQACSKSATVEQP